MQCMKCMKYINQTLLQNIDTTGNSSCFIHAVFKKRHLYDRISRVHSDVSIVELYTLSLNPGVICYLPAKCEVIVGRRLISGRLWH